MKVLNLIVLTHFSCAHLQGAVNLNLSITQSSNLNNQQQPIVTSIPLPQLMQQTSNAASSEQLFPSVTFSWNSSLKLGLGSLAVSYGALLVCVLQAKTAVFAKDDLASWRCEVALQALQELPKNTILLDLMRMSQKNTNNTTQSGIVGFLEQIAHEEQMLQRYKKIISVITFFKATSIFPDISTLATQLEEKLQRLAFMHDCIQEWLLLQEHDLLQTT